MDLSVVVGNPKPRSRTLSVTGAVAEQVAAATGATLVQVVDLCDYADDLFKWPHAGLASLNETIAASDFIVLGTPTYKASYTGLLKAFLDRYPNNGLAGATVVPVMTAGSEQHAMAVDTALRPVLVELGASVPTRGVFFLMSRMGEMQAVVDEWAAQNLHALPGPLAPILRGGLRGGAAPLQRPLSPPSSKALRRSSRRQPGRMTGERG